MSEEVPGGTGASGGVHLPVARSAGLIVTEMDDELIVYDEDANHIHRLNSVSAAVWRHCDGRRTLTEVAVAATTALGATVDAAAVAIALSKLNDASLLVDAVAVPRTSRPRFTRRAAMLGAAAVPAVVSITAPFASASASGCTGDDIEEGLCHRVGEGRCCIPSQPPIDRGVCRKVSSGGFNGFKCVLLNETLGWFGG